MHVMPNLYFVTYIPIWLQKFDLNSECPALSSVAPQVMTIHCITSLFCFSLLKLQLAWTHLSANTRRVFKIISNTLYLNWQFSNFYLISVSLKLHYESGGLCFVDLHSKCFILKINLTKLQTLSWKFTKAILQISQL